MALVEHLFIRIRHEVLKLSYNIVTVPANATIFG